MDSDDYSTDENTRKRRAGTSDGDVFKKSVKVARTPKKEGNRGDQDKLDVLIDLVKELKTEIQQIREEQNEYREEITNIRKENLALRKENEEIKKECKEMKGNLAEVRDTVERLEKEKRRNNVIITGIGMGTYDTDTLKESLAGFIKEHLEIEVNIKVAHKLGENICLVELGGEQDKERIMKRKHKLKEITGRKIYINDDLTKKEREIAKKLRKIASEERSKRKHVKIGFVKDIIEGREWRWNKDTGKIEETGKKTNEEHWGKGEEDG